MDNSPRRISAGKVFCINEIANTLTVMAILQGGVVRTYRFYFMPQKTLIGDFDIGIDSINKTRNKQ
ncbi:hypothetical protein SAMN02745664_103128 [Moraxella cuniculi DSM 21768]|uniref:Uncharacterized protein n=1 Tax=Moraxella cuniculi DSM 21768 TaxID=1122245 RepID=A0A1N7E6Q9_9GAMM|nr:hypothetical protein [Moraxella cuniculi]OOS06607.1 hypothetical protein B0189_04570 [Moraxella cuniculi]SIR83719.1 hypothetical protein SAMN02745664_103128 [Moraxella cuniculi DSM 21768]